MRDLLVVGGSFVYGGSLSNNESVLRSLVSEVVDKFSQRSLVLVVERIRDVQHQNLGRLFVLSFFVGELEFLHIENFTVFEDLLVFGLFHEISHDFLNFL